MVSSYIVRRYFSLLPPEMATSLPTEEAETDDENNGKEISGCHDVEIIEEYDTESLSETLSVCDALSVTEAHSVSEYEIQSDVNEQDSVELDETEQEYVELDGNEQDGDCVEVKDSDGHIENHDTDESTTPRVINLVDQDDQLNHSVISVESSVAGSAVEEVVISSTPNKLRRSARASARRYRQSNKISTSSDSESEVVFVKKTQKRKDTKGRLKSRSKRSTSNDERSDDDKTIEKKVEKENKNSEKKKLREKRNQGHCG